MTFYNDTDAHVAMGESWRLHQQRAILRGAVPRLDAIAAGFASLARFSRSLERGLADAVVRIEAASRERSDRAGS